MGVASESIKVISGAENLGIILSHLLGGGAIASILKLPKSVSYKDAMSYVSIIPDWLLCSWVISNIFVKSVTQPCHRFGRYFGGRGHKKEAK